MLPLLLAVSAIGIARADDCQTFCENQLGKRACKRRTWCTDDLSCHSLYWTGPDRSEIFFGDDYDDYSDYPVRCSAFSGLPDILLPPIDLHRRYDDCRPRVRVRFVGHPGVSPKGKLSFLLDTGSSDTYVFSRNNESSDDAVEAYVDRTPEDCHVGGPRVLYFGPDCAPHPVHVLRTIPERIEVIGRSSVFQGRHGRRSFSHFTSLALTAELDEGAGTGLYAAGRESGFEEAVGIFTFIPNQEPHLPWTKGFGGSLMVSERRTHVLNSLCAWGPVHWFPVKPELSTNHWVVGGTAGLEGSSQRLVVDWTVDTGDKAIHIPPDMFADLVDRIRAAGGIVDDEHIPNSWTLVHDCYVEDTPMYPTLLISMGEDLTFRIEPADYLEFRADDVCRLNILTDPVEAERPPLWLVGMVFLGKTVTTFDRKNDQIGFCPPPPRSRGGEVL